MTINNLPSAIQQIVQDGWLLRFFDDALYPTLMFRGAYDAMEVPQHLGQQYTFTKKGLLPIVQDALAPVTNSDLTSGLTPVSVGYEQYTATLSQYAAAVQTNMLSSGIAIVDLYKSAVQDLGFNAGQSLDIQARRVMSQAYNGGRTYLTAVATAATTLTVKDVSGFDFVYVNGVRTATSVSNPLAVTVAQSGTPIARNVTGVTPGSANNAEDMIPGTLTINTAVTSVVGDAVISSVAPFSVRPGGKTTSYNLLATDILTLANLNAATARLRSMGVPAFDDGFYKAYLTPEQVSQLMNDNAVQRVYDTHPDAAEFQRGLVAIGGGCKIFLTNQPANGLNESGVLVQRGFIAGKEAGYEVRSSLIADWLSSSGLSATGAVVFSPKHYVAMILRTPLDTLQQVVTNSWSFIGDWVMATDVYGFGNSSAVYRRMVSIQSGSAA